MAKTTKTSVSFRDIVTSIRKGNFAPVYILSGEEEYFIDQITDLLEERVIDESDRDFNLFTYYGADADIDVVAASARQFPLTGGRQLVLLKEAQAMDRAKTRLDRLASYVEKPVLSTVLVIAYKGEALGASSKLVKAADAGGGVVFRSDRVKDYNIAPHLRDYCSSRGLRIDDKAVSMLTELQGTELKKIFGEIDKIAVAEKGLAKTITVDLVERHTGFSKDFNNFELTSALAVKDYRKAMTIVDYFSRSPRQHPTVATVALLFNFYSKLVIAGCLRERTDSAIMSAIGAKSEYAIREIKTAMRFYSLRQSASCVAAIRDFDCQAKGIGSIRNEFDLLRELVFKLVTL